MASTFQGLLFTLSIIFFSTSSPSIAQPSFRPKALLLPITRDPSLQYITAISQRTPLLLLNFTFDLNGPFLWANCDNGFSSSTSRTVPCRSAQCPKVPATVCGKLFDPVNDTCGVFPDNSVVHTGSIGGLLRDIISVRSTDGSNPGRPTRLSNFIFSCGSSFINQGLAGGAVGMVGFGRTPISAPVQLAAGFSIARKFALCLSSSNGVVFLGNVPYKFLPNVELSNALSYTPLILNRVNNAGVANSGDPSPEYHIGVKSIEINEKPVRFNASLLSIDERGRGGTRISTVDPYTVLETSIYDAVVKAFDRVVSTEAPRVAAVAPFGMCYDIEKIVGTRLGPRVPTIGLVLEGGNVWRIVGGNSMVVVSNRAICLGIVDGGRSPRTAVVIGGRQLEDNLLEFDLAGWRLGFSNSLLSRQTTCANFNSTVRA